MTIPCDNNENYFIGPAISEMYHFFYLKVIPE